MRTHISAMTEGRSWWGTQHIQSTLSPDRASTLAWLTSRSLLKRLRRLSCKGAISVRIHSTPSLRGDHSPLCPVGSRTALLPYTRARWFENHKILSAVDKLHKLYSTTLPPVVWARSVGLEVINELDTIKAALMITAGGSGGGPRAGNGGWDVAARGLENLNGAADTAKVVRNVLVNAAGVGLQQLGNALSQIGRR